MAKVTRNKPDDKGIVIQSITVNSVNRQTQDISNWRAAIKRFENKDNPVRTALYDLLEDILLDGHLESVCSKRTEAITNRDLLFVKDGTEDPEINRMLNSPGMISLIKDLHETIYWGYSLVQVNRIELDPDKEQYIVDYDLIPRKHVHPEKGLECISKDQNQVTKDILYKEPPLSKYMIWAGTEKGLGLLTKAAQYVIYKRGNFGDWAQFAEMFGMPFREGRYDDFDDKTRVALEKMMEAYGGANYAILPKGAEFKLHEAVKGTAGDLYKGLKDACNDEISKIILGNTLTTEQGDKGSRSLGEVHAEVEQSKFQSDQRFILSLLNGPVKAVLKAFGFNVQGGDIWFRSPDADWNQLKVKWEVISGISNKVPIDDDFIYEEFDIPKPENYEQLKEEMQLRQTTFNPGLNDPKTTFKQDLNDKNKGSILKAITDFFV